uniref:Retrotransposon protein, putative, Ty3-gypsy subclass n=1 Tax=Oryza sativa subsp. japonica TaxID=39947 RepID=Q2QXV1_ORYSJ|nr:retrotransposon protein, putative, Ty3-gypsy subclass [Oryza sativa Japonica Group]
MATLTVARWEWRSGGEPRRKRGGRGGSRPRGTDGGDGAVRRRPQRRLVAAGVAETAAARGCTARERWEARESSAKWGKSERVRRRSLNRERGGQTWPREAGIAGRRGEVGKEREAGFENRIPAISGAGAGGRERGVGAGNAAHARAWSTWPEGGGDVGAATVAGAAARRERREVGEGPDRLGRRTSGCDKLHLEKAKDLRQHAHILYRIPRQVSVGASVKRGRLIPYHIVCMVSAEAPISPLPVRGLLAVCHETLRPDLPKPCDQSGFRLKVLSSSGRSPMVKAVKPHGEDNGTRTAKDGAPWRRLYILGEGCPPKEGDFAILAALAGLWAGIRQPGPLEAHVCQ